jgi:hypothetical protein
MEANDSSCQYFIEVSPFLVFVRRTLGAPITETGARPYSLIFNLYKIATLNIIKTFKSAKV